MSFVFDKSGATTHDLWVDSIIGFRSSLFSTAGRTDRGTIKILTQAFHPQDLNHGPYAEMRLHLDTEQIDQLIQNLMKLKEKMT